MTADNRLPRLGRVTTVRPLTVTVTGDLQAAPAEGAGLVVGQEVLVENVGGRRIARPVGADTGWLAPVLLAPFTNYGTPHTCSYRKLHGVVFIRGLVNSSVAGGGARTVFQLPVGFRPVSDAGHLFAGMTDAGIRRFDVRPAGSGYAGEVTITDPAAAWNSLECSFPADN